MAEASSVYESGLTCLTCRLAFASGEVQKEHYRSDWHRYNVKRQVASLPPISLDDFKSKEEAYADGETSAKVQAADVDLHCQACQKTYKSQNSFENHAKSRKHKENATLFAAMEDEMPSGVVIRRETRKERAALMEQTPAPEEDHDTASTSSWETVGSDDDLEYVDDGTEPAFLVLPSGATIGHRSLFRYFRQHLKPVDKVQPKQEHKWRISDTKLRSLGWTGAAGTPEAAQIARDVKHLQKTVARYQQRLGVKGNKLFRTKGRKDQQ